MKKYLAMVCLFFLVSCATMQPSTSLYEDLGGEEGVDKIVDNFINEIGYDKQVYNYFAESNINRFRDKMTSFICSVTDGPCEYDGESMLVVHANMGVTETDFNRVVDLVYTAMKRAGLSHALQNRLIARLEPQRQNIIYK